MTLFLVTIQDKELDGEPDIAMCVVEAEDEHDALEKSGARAKCIELAEVCGWGRCVPHAREWSIEKWSRTSFLVRGAARCRGYAT